MLLQRDKTRHTGRQPQPPSSQYRSIIAPGSHFISISGIEALLIVETVVYYYYLIVKKGQARTPCT